MKEFKHINASSLEEAASVLGDYEGRARIIAGGTDLLGQMKDDILPEFPEVVVNVKTISGLDYIKVEDKRLKIGALTRLDDIARDNSVKNGYSILAEAARRTASPHIRESGTIGGNICQSNRCWYYWVPGNRFYCMRKGGKECYALIGDGRYHSIFGAARVDSTPCSMDCPANVDIPSYLRNIRGGNLAGAAELLLTRNPLPSITGRVCPHFCESECNRGNLDEPISIRCIERFMGDYILENMNSIMRPPQHEITKSIAVVGSGPAGLSVAYYLRKLGYSVTVFEVMEEPGGMLTYGIPPYRLPKDIVRKQVEALKGTGIQFKTGVKIGKDSSVEQLMKDFDAVFLACGAWKERPSGITGERLLLSGTEFLRNSNRGVRKVPGNKVAVIGGGNVAMDVARVLLRLGAEPVVIYRRSKAEMPAVKEEVEKAEQEGIEIRFLTLPLEVSEKNGKTALTCTKMELGPPDESGRPRPVPVKGSEFTVEFDAVLSAIGEEPDTSSVPDEFIDDRGWLKVNISTSSLGKNVFAGGDFVTGPSTVVAAIAAGRKAADSINRYLGGEEPGSAEGAEKDVNFPETFNSLYMKKKSRIGVRELSVSERTKSMDIEDVSAPDLADIETEANRCFNCGCVAVNSSDMAPALIALDAKIRTTKRTIVAERFFAVKRDNSTVLDMDEVVTEIEVPEPAAGTKCMFTKFALRKSIDFPIVNCAAAIRSEGGVVTAARICLNAVYNQPYRAIAAEEYIKGKAINGPVAEAAADAAMVDVSPLPDNRYKIQIAKTLIKRAILSCSSSTS
jgi:NADPH-dependent glutamate synthase beta subunit-like oxidoreductase/CO/xanthine dehydrogenase FAD-binding subunit